MASQIQLRRDTAANWTSANPVLAQGEFGIESNTKKVKLGDGTTAWNSLAYFAANISDISGLQDALDGKQAIVSGVSSTEIGYLDGVTSAIQTQLDSKAPLTTTVNAKTANYTLAVGDKGELITCDGTFTITAPSATFATGDRVDFINIGAGVITFAGSGVTINSIDDALTVDTQWAGATLFFTSSTTAVLIGRLA